MTTKFVKPVRREVLIDREPWVVTIDPAGLKVTRKGRRKGVELGWKGLVSGDAELAVALNASLRGASRQREPHRNRPKRCRASRVSFASGRAEPTSQQRRSPARLFATLASAPASAGF
jgi:hypothetical protein